MVGHYLLAMRLRRLAGADWGAAVAAACAAWFALLLAAGTRAPVVYDGAFYTAMARDRAWPGPPFGFRVGTPWLVNVLPTSTPAGFDLLAVGGLTLACWLLYRYLRTFYDQPRSVFGVALFASGAAVSLVLSPRLVDPLALAAVVGALLAARRGHWWATVPILMAGVVVKENTLVVLVALWALVTLDRRGMRPVAVATLAAGATYLALHRTGLLYGHVEPSISYFSLDNVRSVWHRNITTENSGAKYAAAVVTQSFAVLWLAAIPAWRRADRWIRVSAVMVLPVAASILVATDAARLLGYAFVVVVPLVCALGWRRGPAALLVASQAALTAAVVPLHGSNVKYLLEVVLLTAGLAALLSQLGLAKLLEQLALRPRTGGEVFGEIYRRNLWLGGGSVSGPGSDLEQTRVVAEALPVVMRELGATSLLDVPCGDFHWMRTVDLSGVDYLGADLVPELVAANQRWAGPGIAFRTLDLLTGPLPRVDVVLCRDGLVHLSFADAIRALRNICESGSRFLLTTTYPERVENTDIKTGDWRPLNLELTPFGLPTPRRVIVEDCRLQDGAWADKSLGLWAVDDVRAALVLHR